MPEWVRQKISQSKKGVPNPKRRGIPLSEETKQKLRLANLGHKDSDQTREKKRLAGLGRKIPPEVIEKRRITRRKNLEMKAWVCRLCGVPITGNNDINPSDLVRENWLCRSCDRLRGKETKRRIKQDVMDHYGGMCSCPGCRETRIEFLTMDHKDNDGAEQDKLIGRLSGQSLYSYIRVNNYPAGFRIMCWNCNCARGVYGYCPHEKEVMESIAYARARLQ